MNTDKHEFSDSLTEQVLAGVFEVSNTLGAGFLEKVYERALLRELGLRGLRTTAQAAFVVKYKGFAVGEYFADILVLVEDTLMGRTEMRGPLSQLSQVKVSGRTVCLLANLQRPKVEWKRIVLDFQIGT